MSGLPRSPTAVEEAGGELEGDDVLLARNVSAEGRSRAFVGGASVPVSELAAVAEPLVAVHGQADQHRLLQPRAQRDALDAFGGDAIAPLLADYRELHAELLETERELSEVVASARERAREADLLRFGLGEIEAVAPDAGRGRLAGRRGAPPRSRRRAPHRGRVGRAALSSDDGGPDALAAVAAARTLLDGVRDHDPAAADLADRVAELTYLLSDLAADVASYASGLETDPARLAVVSERRAALTALTRKYGETAADVLAWAETSAARLAQLDDTDDRISRLRDRRDDLRGRLGPAAAALSEARTSTAARLSTELTGELDLLAMPHARARRRGAADRDRRRTHGRRADPAVRVVRGRRGRVPARRQHRERAAPAPQGRVRW